MIRAGRKITVDVDAIQSEDGGMMFAPIINLCGLILRSDRPVPNAIKVFLASQDVQVNRIRYLGELHIRLTGTYRLSKAAIKHFISNHPGVVAEQSEGLEAVPEAIKLQHQINDVVARNPLRAAFFKGDYYSTGEPKMGGKAEPSPPILHLTHPKGIQFTGTKRTNVFIASAPKQSYRGTILPGAQFGFFAECRATRTAAFTGTVRADNTLIDAGSVVSFEPASQEDTLTLAVNSSLDWGNSPVKGR